MTHPLDREFDIEGERMLDDDYVRVEIPESQEERNLDLIINLALKAYKEQMDDIIHIEPKNRLKYLEVSERFLNQAKDAMYKRDYLKARRAGVKGDKAPTVTAPQEEGNSTTVDRTELLNRIRAVK